MSVRPARLRRIFLRRFDTSSCIANGADMAAFSRPSVSMSTETFSARCRQRLVARVWRLPYMVTYLWHHICTFGRAEVCESDHERPRHVHVFSRKFWLSASTRVCVGRSRGVLCRPVLCQLVSCRNRLVLNGKCTSHRIHVKLNVCVTFEGTSRPWSPGPQFVRFPPEAQKGWLQSQSGWQKSCWRAVCVYAQLLHCQLELATLIHSTPPFGNGNARESKRARQ